MKNILVVISMLMLFSCAGNTKKSSTPDSINAIETRPPQDTTVSPNPNGYTPPNTKTDTSQRVKDSVNASKH